jgi:hypothetical protein
MRFKTNKNIFVDLQEFFNENWMDTDVAYVPPSLGKWDYSREMTIDDVDLWEVIYEQGGGVGVFAAYSPMAEFYMIRTGGVDKNLQSHGQNYHGIELFYGRNALRRTVKRMDELGIPYPKNQIWVDNDDIWLYT